MYKRQAKAGARSQKALLNELTAIAAEVTGTNIAANAPLSIKAAKIIIGEAAKEKAHRDTSLCQALVDACHESDDYKEGQHAFAEKRLPLFKGT